MAFSVSWSDLGRYFLLFLCDLQIGVPITLCDDPNIDPSAQDFWSDPPVFRDDPDFGSPSEDPDVLDATRLCAFKSDISDFSNFLRQLPDQAHHVCPCPLLCRLIANSYERDLADRPYVLDLCSCTAQLCSFSDRNTGIFQSAPIWELCITLIATEFGDRSVNAIHIASHFLNSVFVKVPLGDLPHIVATFTEAANTSESHADAVAAHLSRLTGHLGSEAYAAEMMDMIADFLESDCSECILGGCAAAIRAFLPKYPASYAGFRENNVLSALTDAVSVLTEAAGLMPLQIFDLIRCVMDLFPGTDEWLELAWQIPPIAYSRAIFGYSEPGAAASLPIVSNLIRSWPHDTEDVFYNFACPDMIGLLTEAILSAKSYAAKVAWFEFCSALLTRQAFGEDGSLGPIFPPPLIRFFWCFLDTEERQQESYLKLICHILQTPATYREQWLSSIKDSLSLKPLTLERLDHDVVAALTGRAVPMDTEFNPEISDQISQAFTRLTMRIDTSFNPDLAHRVVEGFTRLTVLADPNFNKEMHDQVLTVFTGDLRVMDALFTPDICFRINSVIAGDLSIIDALFSVEGENRVLDALTALLTPFDRDFNPELGPPILAALEYLVSADDIGIKPTLRRRLAEALAEFAILLDPDFDEVVRGCILCALSGLAVVMDPDFTPDIHTGIMAGLTSLGIVLHPDFSPEIREAIFLRLARHPGPSSINLSVAIQDGNPDRMRDQLCEIVAARLMLMDPHFHDQMRSEFFAAFHVLVNELGVDFGFELHQIIVESLIRLTMLLDSDFCPEVRNRIVRQLTGHATLMERDVAPHTWLSLIESLPPAGSLPAEIYLDPAAQQSVKALVCPGPSIIEQIDELFPEEEETGERERSPGFDQARIIQDFVQNYTAMPGLLEGT
jgi:hypothetical protein